MFYSIVFFSIGLFFIGVYYIPDVFGYILYFILLVCLTFIFYSTHTPFPFATPTFLLHPHTLVPPFYPAPPTHMFCLYLAMPCRSSSVFFFCSISILLVVIAHVIEGLICKFICLTPESGRQDTIVINNRYGWCRSGLGGFLYFLAAAAWYSAIVSESCAECP